MVDPVEEVSDIALERGLPLHVDSCIGGFMLPWSAYMHCSSRGLQLTLFCCRVEKLGYPVPVFDFRLAGVTSMSADVHKYGLGAKVSRVTSLLFLLSCQLPPPPLTNPALHMSHCWQSSSVVVYRSADIRKHQIFAYSEWPGGLFGSPSMSGTRPGQISLKISTCSIIYIITVCLLSIGGNIASSWAVLQCMGEDGYMDIARRLMLVAEKMKNGINAIEVIK